MNRPGFNGDSLDQGLGGGVNDVDSILRSDGRVLVVRSGKKVAVCVDGVRPGTGKGRPGAVVGEGHRRVGDGLHDGAGNGVDDHNLSKERRGVREGLRAEGVLVTWGSRVFREGHRRVDFGLAIAPALASTTTICARKG